MKNKKKLLFPLLSICFILTGCGGDGQISSLSSSEEASVSEGPISIFEGYVSLEDAIKNTKHYALQNNLSENKNIIEIYLDDMYYSAIRRAGYVELDNDLGYIHAFDTKYLNQDTIESRMIVYGRNGLKENIEDLYSSTLISLIENYAQSFGKKEDHIYASDNVSLINKVADYFQGKIYKYATEIEVTLNQNNRLESFEILEEGATLLRTKFIDTTKENIKMYSSWVNDGSLVEERIYDYKNLRNEKNGMVSLYEGDEVEFTATVVAKDSDNNVYVANRNDSVGHIGIKIENPSNYTALNILDIVTVKGTIFTDNFNAYIKNGTITDTNKDNKYAPKFDEEPLVDMNGGAVYAANLFSRYPYFNDSVYTTYGFVNEITDSYSSTGDTIVDMIFPNQTNGEAAYHMEIIIPESLSETKKNELFTSLKNAKIYGNEEAYELCIEDFIIKYDINYDYRLRLMATEDSNCYKRLTAQEKIEKYYGLSSFPVFEGKQQASYRYGEFLGQLLENEYGITDSKTDGLFVAINNLSSEELLTYYSALEAYGFVKYDEVKDIYSQRHIIYQLGEVNVDMIAVPDQNDENLFSINMWIYKGKLLRSKNIKERIDEKIGEWFDTDNFLKYAGTYDADYKVYELREYAGKFYSEENPLFCVTIDTQEKIFDDYNKGLIEMGYKQYRGSNNRPYSYKTRGQTHYVFYKDDVYLDVATYHTSDYTYTNHDDFEYRLEILIYKGDVMSVDTYSDLSFLSSLYEKVDPSLGYHPTLPSDSVVEVWRDLNDFTITDVEYGYGCRDEAFVYTSDVVGAYDAVKTSLKEAGYKVSGLEKTSSILFSKTINGDVYNVLLLKEPEKGYLRVFNSIGGLNFYR